MSATYERELKGLLEELGYFVTRAAGSHGLDLVAVAPFEGTAWMPNTAIIIEEKSTKKNVFYVSDKEQWAEAVKLARAGRNVYYAIRWKSGKLDNRWEFFSIGGHAKPTPMRRGEGLEFDLVFVGAAE